MKKQMHDELKKMPPRSPKSKPKQKVKDELRGY